MSKNKLTLGQRLTIDGVSFTDDVRACNVFIEDPLRNAVTAVSYENIAELIRFLRHVEERRAFVKQMKQDQSSYKKAMEASNE